MMAQSQTASHTLEIKPLPMMPIGNMIKNDEINLAYNTANKTTMITSNSGTTTFAYDMNNNCYKKTSGQGNSTETTTYIGKVYEHTEKEFGFYEDKYFIYAAGKVIAVNSLVT